MRTRGDILKDYAPDVKLTLEILLDIRDILAKANKPVRRRRNAKRKENV